MNKTFKVARSLTRGTVVTSEKASSYQGKAVKTVIAAAVASLVAGAAMAADPVKTTEITSSTQDQVTKLEQGYNGLTIDTQVSDKNSGKNYGAVYINGVDPSGKVVLLKAHPLPAIRPIRRLLRALQRLNTVRAVRLLHTTRSLSSKMPKSPTIPLRAMAALSC